MKKYLLLFILVIAPAAHSQSSFTFDNKRGPYSVGLRAVFQYDESRSYVRAAPTAPSDATLASAALIPTAPPASRPIQTLIWYPANASSNPLTYGDYIEFGVNRENFNLAASETTRLADEMLKAYRWAPEQIALEKVRVQWASRDAPPASGKFPVVIYAPSFRSPAYENSDLCEYLASHGYVVIASPSQGVDDKGMTIDRAGLDAQVSDIHYLMRYASSIPEADTTQIAIIGFSWGGISNAFAAVDRPAVRALVFLDGSIRYYTQLVEQFNLNSGRRFNIPFLYFSQRPPSFRDQQAKMDAGDKVLAKLTSKSLYLVTMNFMSHQDHSSLFIREFGRKLYAAATPEEVSASYGAMAQYVQRFLDAVLKNDKAGLAFMARSPLANKIPPSMMRLQTIRGTR